MKITQCEYCDSKNVSRDRYTGLSFMIFTFLTLGAYLLAIPFMPVTVLCKDCGVQYIAS